MNKHVEKKQQNSSQPSTHAVAQKQDDHDESFQITDGRHGTAVQGKLQADVNNSSRVRQLKAYREMANSSPQVKQLKAYQMMADDYVAATAQRIAPEGEPLQGRFVHRDNVVQRIRIGKKEVGSVDGVIAYMSISKDNFIDKFNEVLGEMNFAPATEATLNKYLTARKKKVRKSITDSDAFITALARHFPKDYVQRENKDFSEAMDKIEKNRSYRTLMDTHGYGYGTDDGASVDDHYNSTLACSLFALLRLKPGFLGAAEPKALHQILRSDPRTKNYDDDAAVAQIRISAGLTYRVPGSGENTVSGFMGNLTAGDRGRKFIIDPDGAAHTYSLEYKSGWKKFDNDNRGGTAPSNDDIKAIWEAA